MKNLKALKEYIENETTSSCLKYEHYLTIINYISQSMIEVQSLENRSCESCKHWNNNCLNLTVNTTGFCMYYGICNGDFEEDMKNNFYCNKWE